MAEANPYSEGNRKLRSSIERLENNARHLKQEINDRVDLLIGSIHSQRKKLLNQVDIELSKAREPWKNFENKNADRMQLKEKLTKELEGDFTLLSKLTNKIDEELNKMEAELPNFRIQWNSKFIRFCEDFEKVGELKVDTHSRREDFQKVEQLKVDKHSRREESKTPLWSTLNRGKADNEVGEPRAIAIDTETSNIFVGDASAGKILIMDRMGKYLDTLTFKKPSSISRMVICQSYIYCRTNAFWHNTLFRLDKNTGGLLNHYTSPASIDAFAVMPDQVFFCDVSSIVSLLPNLTKQIEFKIISPYFKNGSSHVENMENVNRELVLVIAEPTDYPIQIFNKKGIFLRAIAGDIPTLFYSTKVCICIDKHWNIILSSLLINGRKMVNVYDKEGKFLTSIGQKGDEKYGIYHPRGIALDRDGNLIVCNNRKENILQAYRMTN